MSTNKNLHKKEFQPTNEWFNNFRFNSIDEYILETLYDSILENQFSDIEDCLEDSEFLTLNFPSYKREEMEEFIEYDYLIESTFIKNLHVFIKNEKKRLNRIRNEYSENENEWLEDHLF
jgi:hypothetical protein